MPSLPTYYLFSYNLLQASGWALSLWRILSDVYRTKSVNGAYSSAGELICLLQTLAFVEVIHGAVGIVPSGALLPLMQWLGRMQFSVNIVRELPEVQELPSVFITFLVWSLSEVIRYSYYAVTAMGGSPEWLTFVRYNAFIVLYPIGVFPGEMWLMYQAIPSIKKRNLYADRLPFTYDSFIKFVLFIYPFTWMHLYLHLFHQRALKLTKKGNKKLR